ncbi:uncharacterized protein RCO7_14179 [Rhynchosporium graminicola]|uniref:Uncharacterized protein n=1 Tax=Rhynchosporium graminicola TaxID=2792576 RepID=A0A1E1K160_9HELO|nr:uncharacterized protein RCO7_14179 [Rhynchosporium commune]
MIVGRRELIDDARKWIEQAKRTDRQEKLQNRCSRLDFHGLTLVTALAFFDPQYKHCTQESQDDPPASSDKAYKSAARSRKHRTLKEALIGWWGSKCAASDGFLNGPIVASSSSRETGTRSPTLTGRANAADIQNWRLSCLGE